VFLIGRPAATVLITMLQSAPFPKSLIAMADRTAELLALAQKRILILDGAMGTMIQRHGLAEADYRGARFADWTRDLRGNNDLLTLTRPDPAPWPGRSGLSWCALRRLDSRPARQQRLIDLDPARGDPGDS